VESIVEIRQNRLIRYRGTYEDYLVQREANELQLAAAYKNQQREIDRLMDFVNKFRAKNTKATQAQSKLKQIERMDKVDAPVQDDRKIQFRFPQPQRSGLKAINLKDIHHAYGAHQVYQGIDFEAQRGQRIVLVGPNGAGKSTLLKILAGVLPVQEGERKPGHNVEIGYFSQYRTDTLHGNWTVLEEALDTRQPVTEQFARTLLGGFLFQGDDVFKKVHVLSGGEKSRLALVKILLNPPNLLLMDEPTTHLDMSSIDALLAALDQYEGTLIFISHDVYFIRSLANHVVHVHSGQLAHYPGGYQYYLDKIATSAKDGLTAGASPNGSRPDLSETRERPKSRTKEQKRREAEERQARSRRRKSQQTLVDSLEKKIQTLEKRQVELTAELENQETYENPGQALKVNRELTEITRDLELTNTSWETEATKLEDL
jgi:ATP-binding cassette subfamily F protein 3